MDERGNDVVDVAFALAAVTVPKDYAYALARAVVMHLPWFENEAGAGIHPLRGASTDYGVMLLPRRARHVLRLPRRRVADALALAGRSLSIGGSTLAVGAANVRELQPHGALYAQLVATGSDEEQRFLASVADQLKALAAQCAVICGRRRSVRAAGREIVGFGLMLHELAPEQSLLLQSVGLGAERRLGCGILIPHRLAAAVGA